MCMICVELLKQKMTIPEAERAASELVRSSLIDDPKKFDWTKQKHYKKLKEALENLDLEKLNDVLEEGKEK